MFMHGLPLLPVLENKVARENKRHANGRSDLLLIDTGPEQRIHRRNRSRLLRCPSWLYPAKFGTCDGFPVVRPIVAAPLPFFTQMS